MMSTRSKRAIGAAYIAILIFTFLVDAVLNSPTYRDRYGSELFVYIPLALGLGFWLWMLIDLMTKISRSGEIRHPWLWTVLVVLAYVIGAFVYFVVIYCRSPSSAEKAASSVP